jgi:TetR/AcrR family transcriptional repressor of nem operon
VAVKETAERLMDVAEAHMRGAGYGGFSFRDLAAEIGIKSASSSSPWNRHSKT